MREDRTNGPKPMAGVREGCLRGCVRRCAGRGPARQAYPGPGTGEELRGAAGGDPPVTIAARPCLREPDVPETPRDVCAATAHR